MSRSDTHTRRRLASKPSFVSMPADGWERFPLSEFVESGLLQHVNQQVLWDLGLALTVVSPTDADGKPDLRRGHLEIQTTVPPERIESGGVKRPIEKWLAARRKAVRP